MHIKKFIKGIRDIMDELAAQLGLQPKLAPVRIDKNKRRNPEER